MPETTQDTKTGRRPVWSRRWFWMGGGILAGLVVLAALAPRASAFRAIAAGHGFGGRHHSFFALGAHDPTAAKQHVATAVELALGGIGASEEQKQHARKITDRTIDELLPLVAQHREHHAAIVHELAKPQIDRGAIEKLRKEELALADQASKDVLDAVTELAEALTPEQRGELIDLARRFHGEAPPEH